jgi:hypothetical protein
MKKFCSDCGKIIKENEIHIEVKESNDNFCVSCVDECKQCKEPFVDYDESGLCLNCSD